MDLLSNMTQLMSLAQVAQATVEANKQAFNLSCIIPKIYSSFGQICIENELRVDRQFRMQF